MSYPRTVLMLLPIVLVACAGGILEGTPLDTQGPHGLQFRLVSPTSPLTTDVFLFHSNVNRFKYRWTLLSASGVEVASWESVSIWERTWKPGENSRDLGRGVAHLALVALNTLAENNLQPSENPRE